MYHSGPVMSSQYTCQLQFNGWSITCEMTVQISVVIRIINTWPQCRLQGRDIRLLASMSSPIDPRHDVGSHISAGFLLYNGFNKLMGTFMQHTIMPLRTTRGAHGPRGREIAFTSSSSIHSVLWQVKMCMIHRRHSCDKSKK